MFQLLRKIMYFVPFIVKFIYQESLPKTVPPDDLECLFLTLLCKLYRFISLHFHQCPFTHFTHHFQNGSWVMKRRWNGDQTDYGLNLTKPTLLKVRFSASR